MLKFEKSHEGVTRYTKALWDHNKSNMEDSSEALVCKMSRNMEKLGSV